MFHFKALMIFLLLTGFGFLGQAQEKLKNLADYVNTLQGTNSKYELTRGNTYPTTALPFAMHTWTPQTGKNGSGWKYQYQTTTIRGFEQAHQCSSWTNDYCVFSLMPEINQLQVNEDRRAAKFSHQNETGRPYYYSVKFDNQIQTEMAPTAHGVHIRFSFPKSKRQYIVLDGYTGMSQICVNVKNRTISGYVHNGRRVADNQKNYFIIRFNRPFQLAGSWENGHDIVWKNKYVAEGKGIGAFIEFKGQKEVEARVASSYINPEQARLNLSRESGKNKNFETTKASAKQIWNKQLNKIVVEGGTPEQLKTFYSCLFRANLFARKYYEYDVDGNPYYFSPYDGQIHYGYLFSDTGFWDTFRGQFPLNAILDPQMHGRYVSSLLDAYDQFGWLPSWSFPGESGGMIGNHAISLLADAWAKGIRTFDPTKALAAYYHEVSNKGPLNASNGRDGWKEYFTLGYVPNDKYKQATAKTLEYAYDDFCAYQLAKMTGNQFYEAIFKRQMYNYRNVFDSSVGFMRGRNSDGKWAHFDPYEWSRCYTEGNAWHYLWSVFQNVDDLIHLLGGKQAFIQKMDSVFSIPNTVHLVPHGWRIHEMTEMQMANMGQYAHGDEPIQHMPYLYAYAGEPWKTQQKVRMILDKLYDSSENGYPGDEDQGEMSSWYVLSALGFYSVCPGTDQYVLGSPEFKKATIQLENGKKFVIEAHHNSRDSIYINQASLNGKNYTKNYIRYSTITRGGILKFEMSASPNKQRGVKNSDIPFSLDRSENEATELPDSN